VNKSAAGQTHDVEKYIELVTMLSPTIRVYVYLHLFSSCCLPNPQNSTKIRTYSRWKSSRVIDLAANRQCICNFLL